MTNTMKILSQRVPDYVVDVKAYVTKQEWHLLKRVVVNVFLKQWEKAWWVWPDAACDPRVEGGVAQPYI